MVQPGQHAPTHSRLFRSLLLLTRWRLALFNGLAALAGYLLFPVSLFDAAACAATAGVTLLAAGSSAFNQVLEQQPDRLMARTCNRPLPCGTLTTITAIILGSISVLTGLAVLLLYDRRAALLGFVALVWYLAIYTPLKRTSSLSLLAGALCGALPPLVGWCLAGGSLFDFRIMLVAGLLYLWQIPHFWLLQRRHAADYQRAGFVSFFTRINPLQQRLYCGLWLVALLSTSMLLPLFGIIHPRLAGWYAAFPFCLPFLLFIPGEGILCAGLYLLPVVLTFAAVLQKQPLAFLKIFLE